ncbi:hypothetical protein [Corynebacterium sp.]|uniref:hypothetical protein n=1 Tax=Corynebacterium sp. TaxID=1720 RepID=UPI0026DCB6DE|nr:hypothetical protein [Corynebacterium sp.]MDO5032210.1 hypothetical protein [Corynebacterium sp.]
MSTHLYVRTTMTIPGVGTAIHVAELEELGPQACAMQRMIALAPNDAIMGAATPTTSVGNADIPQKQVPHPDTYGDFEGIEAERISAEDFHTLWSEATALYGEL